MKPVCQAEHRTEHPQGFINGMRSETMDQILFQNLTHCRWPEYRPTSEPCRPI